MSRYTERHAASGVKTALPSLETWASQYADDYEIVITIPEFTSICPKTGLPDFATLTITYVPDRLCVELKSLKEYVNAYRSLGIFNENVVNRVLEDLARALRPRRMAVRGVFTPRGPRAARPRRRGGHFGDFGGSAEPGTVDPSTPIRR
jgi:7-cyano-7-deazaguanine reductase